MKKLLFIYNPQAGKGQVRPQLAAILDAFSKAGYLTSAWPTQGPGDATRVAAAIGKVVHEGYTASQAYEVYEELKNAK